MMARWLPQLPPAPALEGLAGPYGAILADPPWAYLLWSGKTATPHRGAEDHYQTVDLDALARMPVAAIAADDCALFLWAVGAHLKQAIALGEAWGFSFSTDVFYWAKQKLIDADQIDLFTGDIAEAKISFGHWSRKQVEPCLLFTRGNPKRLSKGVRQLIVSPAREHSRKPDEARARIEQLVAGPYVELFARQRAPGWDAWGDETTKFGEAA